jgi:hypothetical protein
MQCTDLPISRFPHQIGWTLVPHSYLLPFGSWFFGTDFTLSTPWSNTKLEVLSWALDFEQCTWLKFVCVIYWFCLSIGFWQNVVFRESNTYCCVKYKVWARPPSTCFCRLLGKGQKVPNFVCLKTIFVAPLVVVQHMSLSLYLFTTHVFVFSFVYCICVLGLK